SKDQSYQWTCIEDLPAQGHWEIPHRNLKPVGDEISVHSLEKHSCDKAHDRAHETYGKGRDHQDHCYRSVLARCYDTESQSGNDPSYYEQLQDKTCDHHDRELMKGQKENLIAHTSLIKGDIIYHHGINHYHHH